MGPLLAAYSHIPVAFFVTLRWTLRVVALAIVPKNRHPAAGMAWLLLIFALPAIGWILFLMFGHSKLPKNRQNLQARVDRLIESIDEGDRKARAVIPKKYDQIVNLTESLGHMPVTYADHYEILAEYDEVFKKIIEDVDNAKEIININFYIFGLDETTRPLLDALIQSLPPYAHLRRV